MRSLTRKLAIALALTVSAVSSAGAANLLTNGSFEDATNFADNTGGGAMQLFPPATNLTGWTVTGGNDLLWAGPGSFAYMGALAPSDGSYFLDLTGLTNVVPYAGVTQTINTVNGQRYRLSFDQGGRADSVPETIQATAGATSQSFSASFAELPWVTESMEFTATGSTTAITLLGTVQNGFDIGLDNVVVEAVPEPATWAMFLLGFGGIGFVMRGRRKIAVTA